MADNSNISSLLAMVQEVEDRTSMSLTQYTKKCTVNSRTFIDSAIANEPVLNDIMLNMMNLYCGLILTAVNMNAYVSEGKRVRDFVNIAATENLKSMSAINTLHRVMAGMEAMNNDADATDGSSVIDNSGIDTYLKNDTPLPSGRILNLKLSTDRGAKIDVNLLVQLNPTIIATEVLQQFIALNFAPSFKTRLLQAKAGEISTFKDLVMCMDLRRERLRALKKDSAGELQSMLDRQSNSLSDALLKIFQLVPEKQNIANSILIFDKQNFDSEASKCGLKITDYNSRQKFFNKTFAMIVAIVDTMYNRVEMYYHGMPTSSTFTYDQLKKNSKIGNTDLVQIMQSYAAGSAPKF